MLRAPTAHDHANGHWLGIRTGNPLSCKCAHTKHEYIPKNVASRGTIQSILDMGVKLGIYNKLAYPNDKRVKLYNLSKTASSEIDRFFKSFLDLSKTFNKKI